jgi:hypothetical protein
MPEPGNMQRMTQVEEICGRSNHEEDLLYCAGCSCAYHLDCQDILHDVVGIVHSQTQTTEFDFRLYEYMTITGLMFGVNCYTGTVFVGVMLDEENVIIFCSCKNKILKHYKKNDSTHSLYHFRDNIFTVWSNTCHIKAIQVPLTLAILASLLHPTQHQKLKRHYYSLLLQMGSPSACHIHGWGNKANGDLD